MKGTEAGHLSSACSNKELIKGVPCWLTFMFVRTLEGELPSLSQTYVSWSGDETVLASKGRIEGDLLYMAAVLESACTLCGSVELMKATTKQTSGSTEWTGSDGGGSGIGSLELGNMGVGNSIGTLVVGSVTFTLLTSDTLRYTNTNVKMSGNVYIFPLQLAMP